LAAALWTKGLALALPPLVLVAYLVAGSTIGDNWKARWHAVRRPVAIVAGGGVVGGLWWLRNLIDYGTVQINGFGPGFLRTVYGPQDNHGTFLRFLPEFTTDFVGRIWGEIGIPDSPSPGPFVIYGWFFVVLIGFVAALLVREQHRARLGAAVLAAMPVLVIGVVAGGSFATFRHWSHGTHGSQGRYLYPTIVVIAALATIGWLRILRPRIGAVLLPIGVVGALLTNAAAWLLILRSWYEPTSAGSGLRGLRATFHSLLRWSPIPSIMTVLLVVVFPVLAGIICLIAVSRDAHQLRRVDVEMSLSDIAVGP
jgi:hypothetical protein